MALKIEMEAYGQILKPGDSGYQILLSFLCQYCLRRLVNSGSRTWSGLPSRIQLSRDCWPFSDIPLSPLRSISRSKTRLYTTPYRNKYKVLPLRRYETWKKYFYRQLYRQKVGQEVWERIFWKQDCDRRNRKLD